MRFTSIPILFVLAFVSGCSQDRSVKPAILENAPLDISGDAVPSANVASDQAEGAQDTPVAATDDPNAPMVFEWQTGYSGFISAPIDVRSAAHNACQERGLAVAVMANLALDGDSARATFTCRGDIE
ncbi:hypothetical protein N8835_03550 [Alphaproteobacteria bacterium]|nr:hypothetical protein [Alphaproteobacteria bacterium]